MPTDSGDIFYLIDHDGHRRVPHKKQSEDGRYGYAIHPKGKGNANAAASYTEDERQVVEAVVFDGKGVRTTAKSGPQAGRSNTLGLSGRKIRGYWLAPQYFDWVKGAETKPENQTS